MKIAIVSDTHNNWANFKKAIDWIKNQNIQLILHCGDISSQETIDEAKKYFSGDIKFVRGNADFDMQDLPDKLEIEIVDPPSSETLARRRKIGFCHFPDMAKKLAQSGKFDLVFYGHTHRPWDELVLSGVEGKKCHMINPGELAGQFYKPSFAVYNTETGKLELKILEKL
ncbi:MAG: YfcE family phosphodiesterase [Candidatus Staskawiczbacteria bacterium]|nr:YfcE family phosphodiesterase [Candidatus Staskawiczbacteria bacterium]